MTRQFLYLRGDREFFVVFDRVEATRPEFRPALLPPRPHRAAGQDGNRLTWLSLPEADGDKTVLSHGRSRMFLHTLLPAKRRDRPARRAGPGGLGPSARTRPPNTTT